MTSAKISYPLNKQQASDYFEVSRGTVAKAIKKNNIEPICKKRGVDMYELKDIAAALVKPKTVVRSDRHSFDAHEISVIDSIKTEFEGDMKQYHAYQQALSTKQKREVESGQLIQAETVVAVVGSIVASIDRVFRKVPQLAENICDSFTHKHSTKLDDLLAQEKRAFLKSAQELADDAEQRIQERD